MAEQVAVDEIVVSVGSTIGAAVSIVTTVAQEANNRIRNDLCNKRHGRKADYVDEKNVVNNKLSTLREERKQNQDSLDNVNDKIAEEEKAISTFENVTNDANIQFMVGLGNTGDGKSTVLNRLCGDKSKWGDAGPFEANDSDQSVTQKPKHKECMINNVKSVVVDTPGYKDSKNRDNLHFNNIESYLYGCGGVDAFLLVTNGTKVRFDGNFQSMMNEYVKYFGTSFWKHLIIILTRIEGIEKEKFNDRDRGKILQQNLKGAFKSIDDNCNVPIITIGFGDDYATFCRTVMNEVVTLSNTHSKLVCNQIKSPIKILRAKRDTLQKEIQRINNDIAPEEQKINELNAKIAEMNEKLNNPEKYPLITNYSATI